jgi:hypothetical protein
VVEAYELDALVKRPSVEKKLVVVAFVRFAPVAKRLVLDAFVVVPLVAVYEPSVAVVLKRLVRVPVVLKKFVDDAFVVVPAAAVKVLRYALFATVSAVVLALPSVEVPVVVMNMFWKVGVPVNTGDAENTRLPLPVLSVTSVSISFEVSISVERMTSGSR